MENNELQPPEYNPQKYKIAYKVFRMISICMFAVMAICIVWILCSAFFDAEAFVISVNGVPTKQWGNVVATILTSTAIFGLLSLSSHLMYWRMKQANIIFSEPDPQKRLAMIVKAEYLSKN